MFSSFRSPLWRKAHSVSAAALFALFLLAASTPFVRAQAVSGNIIGTVTDSTGAAVANAQVSINDLDRRSVVPDDDQRNRKLLSNTLAGRAL